MAKDLTTSAIERQNVLNNTVALPSVAAGHIDEELLARIIPPVIKGEDFSEELKIDIAHAMESGELFSD